MMKPASVRVSLWVFLVAGWASADASAAPLFCVRGPDLGQQVCDNQTVPGSGDFAPAVDVLGFFFSGAEIITSGTAIAGHAPAGTQGGVPNLTATTPSYVPPPAFFLPPGGTTDMYMASFGGGGTLGFSDVYNPTAVGPATQTSSISGYVFFPTAGNQVVNIEMAVNGPFPDFITFNVFSPGTAGAIVPFASPLSTVAGTLTGNNTLQVDLTTRFLNGPAAVYLPSSADLRVNLVPEPAVVSLFGIIGVALGGRRWHRRHRMLFATHVRSR